MTRQEYREVYLLSDHWKNKRKEKEKQGNKKCSTCGRKTKLDLHHKTYKRLGNEDLDDLMWLCRKHHDYIHSLSGTVAQPKKKKRKKKKRKFAKVLNIKRFGALRSGKGRVCVAPLHTNYVSPHN